MYWNVLKCPTEALYIIINHLIPYKELQICHSYSKMSFSARQICTWKLCIKENYLPIVKTFLLWNLTVRLRTLQWSCLFHRVASLFQLEAPLNNPSPSSRYSQTVSFKTSNQFSLYSESCGRHCRNHTIHWVTKWRLQYTEQQMCALSNTQYDTIHFIRSVLLRTQTSWPV
jgi:hypothetical protein